MTNPIPTYCAPALPYTVEEALERARRSTPATEDSPYRRAPDFPGHAVSAMWNGRVYVVCRENVDEAPRYAPTLEEALERAGSEYRAGVPGSMVLVVPSPDDAEHPALQEAPWTREVPEYPWFTWRHARAMSAVLRGPDAERALLTAATEADYRRAVGMEPCASSS